MDGQRIEVIWPNAEPKSDNNKPQTNKPDSNKEKSKSESNSGSKAD